MTRDEFYLRAIISMAGNNHFSTIEGQLKIDRIIEEAERLEDEICDIDAEIFENTYTPFKRCKPPAG